jgi:hypothetical protein
MNNKVAEIGKILSQEGPAKWIVHYWDLFNRQRDSKMSEWRELTAYLFATDTTTTSNNTLPWKNTTTLPKLAQIRDNLYSNYISALFPNDQWLTWKGYDKQSVTKDKAQTIQTYMANKTREGKFTTEVGKMLLDYIDFGNAFAMPAFETRYKEVGGDFVKSYVGPKAVRIDPKDIVFNPLATEFSKTFKIIRSIKTIGELKRNAETLPEQAFWAKAIDRRMKVQASLSRFGIDDVNKAQEYSVDGFGNLFEYYMSDYVEILEFYGDFHNNETGELSTNRMITVVDRSVVVRDEPIQTYSGEAPIFHVGWRKRPGNLWAMGPLDNLVGLQYRLDHLENLKSDAMDLCVHPPLKIIGGVEEFVWGPGAEILIDDGGDVQEVAKNLNGVITAASEIQAIEDRMELYAGAPREAMGIRTPGEKTAFEVQSLQNAAGRIFQEKINNFEVELLEPLLNAMLEISHRNFVGSDILAVVDRDLGVTKFQSITKEDITANGVLRPIGARHFARKAQELQNLLGIMGSPIGQMLQPHTSSIGLIDYVNDTLGLVGYDIFKKNVAIDEQAETQRLMQQVQEDLAVEQQASVEGDEF